LPETLLAFTLEYMGAAHAFPREKLFEVKFSCVARAILPASRADSPRYYGHNALDLGLGPTIIQPRLSLAQGLRMLFTTSRQPGTVEKSLDRGQFESTMSCLKADRPLEDGQMGNPG
jgi:hypothetical protein